MEMLKQNILLSIGPSAKATVSTLLSHDYVPAESHGYHVSYGIQYMLLCYVLSLQK